MKNIMKVLLVVFLIITIFAGSWLKTSLILGGSDVSEHERCVNHCMQSMLWIPSGVVLSVLFMFYPEKVIQWLVLIPPLSFFKNDSCYLAVYKLGLRIFGFLLLILSGVDLWNQCKIVM